MYHEPVLLSESVEGLSINPNGIYIDVTFGGGGHSREIIKNLSRGQLFAFDQDTDANNNILEKENFKLLNMILEEKEGLIKKNIFSLRFKIRRRFKASVIGRKFKTNE